jgi:hypothetical protein
MRQHLASVENIQAPGVCACGMVVLAKITTIKTKTTR